MTSIAIIGAGFGGLTAAIELKRLGFDDLVVLDKADDVGGVWRDNTYPGAACDVPTPYYSLSYEPNPRWPRRYAAQPDILAYLDHVTDKYDVRRHLRLGTEATGAEWDEEHRKWRLSLAGGATLDADVLVPAVGQLSRPSLPTIEGRADFLGAAFHSARWEHDVDLAGKRVGVIGTGASAVQFVPEIQKVAGSLTVFQRTPTYLVPRMDTEFNQTHHRIFERVPLTQKAERGAWFAIAETLGVALLYSEPLHRGVRALSRSHMRKGTREKAGLFERVWPSYPIGCKRILFSNDYLPALAQPNVDLETGAIERITPAGVRTVDGGEHPLDVLVYGTGFTSTDFLAPLEIRGLDGRDLRDQWKQDGARAYLGITVPGFPNLFCMYGPNTNLGSGSIIYMLESQARYIGQAVNSLSNAGGALVVRREVEQAYDKDLQARLVDGVWSQCHSYYREASGRVSTNWPKLPIEYRRATRTFDQSDYETV